MNIVFIVHTPADYGTSIRAYRWGEYLSQQGFRITLLCSAPRPDFFVRTQTINEHFSLVTLPYIRLHRYLSGYTFRTAYTTLHTLVSSADILHAFTVAQPVTAFPAVVRKLLRRKTLFIDWDDAWGGGFATGHPYPIGSLLTFLESKITLLADEVTCASEYLFQKARTYGVPSDRLHRIENGCTTAAIPVLDKALCREKVGLPHDAHIVLSVGNLITRGVLTLADAFRIVHSQDTTARLVFVGTPFVEQLERSHPDILPWTTFTGKVPFSTLPFYLGASDVLVLPMEDSIVERARFPMRLGDYLCAGRPIVSNAVGEVKRVLEESGGGKTCDVHDHETFARHILDCFSPSIAEPLGRRARDYAEKKLDWSILCKKLVSLYHKYEQ